MAGRIDYPLTEKGRQEIWVLKEKLKDLSFDLAFVSPLLRARQTLEILLSGAETPIIIEPGLLEISLGQWEGLTKKEIMERWPLHWAWRGKNLVQNPPPGGESLMALAGRVGPVFERLKERAQPKTLVVAHQAVNRVILAQSWRCPLAKVLEWPQPTGALTILEFP
jgi:broad specificity phosphatase PhoE